MRSNSKHHTIKYFVMPINTTIFSIGHGQKEIEEFLRELIFYHIQFLVDVRSTPYSKWSPQFNTGVIEHSLQQANIQYLYMGNQIGGRPLNDYCFDDEGYFDYKKMAEEPEFKEGIKRLLNANTKHFKVAIMCSESNPSECHRSKLIGRELYFNNDLNMAHIVGVGKIISQEDIMEELTDHRWNPSGDLFGACEEPYFRSRKAYRQVEYADDLNYSYYD